MRAARLTFQHVDEGAYERCFHFQLESNTQATTDVLVKVPGTPEDCTTEEAFAAAQAQLLTAIESQLILERVGSELWRIPSMASVLRH
ncbi:MAG: hypothetical protein IT563_06585 [Alphaproteobacteria bacterium]|nr:hypothetical protein [Alphaproteobacteria bacterium]